MKISNNKKIDNYHFKLNAKIGSGSFANVYKGKHITTKQKVAVKVIDIKYLLLSSYLNNIKLQLKIIKTLKHQNIIKFINVFQTSNHIYLITQYCENSLYHYIKEEKPLTNSQKFSIIRSLINAIHYLHQKFIVHRDLKPENIMLKNYQCKLIDFGYAQIFKQNKIFNQDVGSTLYKSPQIFFKQKYTQKCDIWALGIIIYEVYFGKTPWNATSLEQLKYKIQNKLPITYDSLVQIPDYLKKIIGGCLQNQEFMRFDIFNIKKFIDKEVQKQHLLNKNTNLISNYQSNFLSPPKNLYGNLRQLGKQQQQLSQSGSYTSSIMQDVSFLDMNQADNFFSDLSNKNLE